MLCLLSAIVVVRGTFRGGSADAVHFKIDFCGLWVESFWRLAGRSEGCGGLEWNRGVDRWREGCCLLRGLGCRRESLERRL